MANTNGTDKTRAFCRNTGTQITDTKQLGDLGIQDYFIRFDLEPGGKTWWNGPYDEAKDFIIATDVPSEDQPTELPQGNIGTVTFWATSGDVKLGKSGNDIDTGSFLSLANQITDSSFTNGNEAYNYLLSQGYWSNFITSSGHQYKPSTQGFPPADSFVGCFNTSSDTFYFANGAIPLGSPMRDTYAGLYITSQSNGDGAFRWEGPFTLDSSVSGGGFNELSILALNPGSIETNGRYLYGIVKTPTGDQWLGAVKFDTQTKSYIHFGTSEVVDINDIYSKNKQISHNSYFYSCTDSGFVPGPQGKLSPHVIFMNEKVIFGIPTGSLGDDPFYNRSTYSEAATNKRYTGLVGDIENEYIYWFETFTDSYLLDTNNNYPPTNSLRIKRLKIDNSTNAPETLWQGNLKGKATWNIHFASIATDYEKIYFTTRYRDSRTGEDKFRSYVFSLKLNTVLYPLFQSPEASSSGVFYDEHNKVAWAIDTSYDDNSYSNRNLLGIDPTTDERFIRYTFTASLAQNRPRALSNVVVNTNDNRIIISNNYAQYTDGGKYITTDNFPGYW